MVEWWQQSGLLLKSPKNLSLKEAKMSASRLLSVLVAVVLVVTGIFVFRAGIATSAVTSALDQSDRHPIDSAALAGQAYMAYRRGEWNAGNSTAAGAFDVEQARLQWRAAK